jgi:hypothetical protein
MHRTEDDELTENHNRAVRWRAIEDMHHTEDVA